jgi:hypothetical protein
LSGFVFHGKKGIDNPKEIEFPLRELTMERVKKTYSKEYSMLRLVPSDVAEIVDFVSEQSNEIEIEADGWKLEQASEIREVKTDKIRNLSIRTLKPYIDIDLGKHLARLYVSSNDETKTIGIGAKIDFILSRRRSSLGALASTTLIVVLITIICLCAVLNFLVPKHSMWVISTLSLASFALLTGCFMIKCFYLSRHCVVYIDENPPSLINFLKRNKDKIIVGIFTSVIGATLGVAGTLFSNWIWRR